MCGIFGYTGKREAVPIILKGLERLEYRGYDSAGIAITNSKPGIVLRKRRGKVRELVAAVSKEALPGHAGLGHTRWATHGIPSDNNSHPHLNENGRIAVVHNGIIENYEDLKTQLKKEGYFFRSDTDSEVIVHLVDKYYRKSSALREAVKKALAQIRGTYAVAVVHSGEPGKIVASRQDSPLVLGLGKGENMVSSDIPAVLDRTRNVYTLENGDLVELNAKSVSVMDKRGKAKRIKIQKIDWSIDQAEKCGFSHFMLKEIFEQPQVIERLIQRRFKGKNSVSFEELKISLKRLRKIKSVTIIACGTSYHAGLAGSFILEELTPYRVSVTTSSEFRYRHAKLDRNTLVIVISQSGETADTLAALREAKRQSALTLAVCNVLGSSIEREAHGVIYTYAGPEIAVASTKAYTAQLAALSLLAFYIRRNVFGKTGELLTSLMREFRRIPKLMREFLSDYKRDEKDWIKNVHQFNLRYHAQLELYTRTDPEHRKRAPNAFFLFLGRNVNYPSALEGALKLKEISYFSAEGYPAGEMKHGPIALIDENPWVICIAVKSATYEKMISNIQEVRARGGIVTAIVTKGDQRVTNMGLFLYIAVPKIMELLSPILVALPLQLIAFHFAKEFGEEIDQPRNLAKSVTVE